MNCENNKLRCYLTSILKATVFHKKQMKTLMNYSEMQIKNESQTHLVCD